MIKYLFSIFVIILLFLTKIYPDYIIPVPEIVKPSGIAVSESRIYISEEAKVNIYSLKDHKFIKKFGNKGEGPKEFVGFPELGVRIEVLKDRLMVNSLGKISFFTKDGTYIKEVRTGKQVSLKYIDENYIGHSSSTKGKIRYRYLTIYNSKFKKIKDLIEWKSTVQEAKSEIDLAPEYTGFHIMGDKIYAAPNSKFAINIFNKNGIRTGSISYSYSRLKIEESYKNNVMNFFKSDRRWKKYFKLIKRRGKFKTYFPAIKMFLVDKMGIYVQTYKRYKNKSEFIIFDLNGKFIKKVFAPFTDSRGINIVTIHTIKNGKMYQLVENEDDDWEIRVFAF